jgi:hypothetical protein
MADISKKLTQLRALYAKMPDGAGKDAVGSKIAKLEASQPKEVVEVKEEVKEVIKKPKAPKKASKGKEMRHVFEKKVDGGKEVKVVMATSVDLAKEAMQESGFEYSRTITRGRSPKEGFSPDSKTKKTKKIKETKRATKASRDEIAKAARMTPEKAEKVAKKVASAKKRGRKPAKHNSYLFEMPMKTQAGKVKRKIIVATSEASAQKQAGRNYTFIKELKAGEKPKTGIQPIKDFVAPPPKKRGRRPKAKAKTEAEMERMSDLYSDLHKKVKGKKSKKSKEAKKSKTPKKTSKSDDLTKDFNEIYEVVERVRLDSTEATEISDRLDKRIIRLEELINKFSKKIESKKFAKGGEVGGGKLTDKIKVRYLNEEWEDKEEEIHTWTIEEAIDRINEDSYASEDESLAYNLSDWLEGWNDAIEGEFYSLNDKDGKPLNKKFKLPTYAKGGDVSFDEIMKSDKSDWSKIKRKKVDWDNFDKLSKKDQQIIMKDFNKDFPKGNTPFLAKGGVVSDEDRGEAVMVSSEGNSVGELQGVDSGTALVDFSDYDRPPSGDKRGYYPISDLRVVEYDWDKDEYYAKGGKTQKEHTFSYRIYDESGDEIDGGSIKMMGEDRETAYNKAVTSIEEGLNEGEEVEVSKLNYEDRFKKGFAN